MVRRLIYAPKILAKVPATVQNWSTRSEVCQRDFFHWSGITLGSRKTKAANNTSMMLDAKTAVPEIVFILKPKINGSSPTR